MAKATYHHGKLREALVEAARAALEERPAEDISLRALAAVVGVSANAPYAHFADRTDLLRAVAAEGFRVLTAETLAAREAATSNGAERLAALARAYLAFALRHPNLYRLMFGPGERGGALAEASTESFAVLKEEVLAVGASDPDRPLFVWALLHGLVTLHLAGRVGPLEQPVGTVEDLADRVAALFAAR